MQRINNIGQIWYQVFFLDNMDVGAYKLPHTVLPRVAEYTPERLKVMIQKSVDCHSADEFFTFAKVSCSAH